MSLSNKKIICAITLGDPGGIGPEIIQKAMASKKIRGLAEYLIIGDQRCFNKQRFKPAKKNKEYTLLDLKNISGKNLQSGRVKAEYGKAAIEYLDKAVELLKAKKIDCLVTAPINKESINLVKAGFTGHTEYIARAFKVKNAQMMLFNHIMKTLLITRHIPLKDVAENITAAGIQNAIKVTAESLRRLFKIKNPGFAVCALNPHASDNGIIGREERKIIIPAVLKTKKNGIRVSGPYPADTIFAPSFTRTSLTQYDCYVCMYHDQALIPLKLSGFHNTVNITLGLPFVRTSPGHGSAFDIAGKGRANPNSIIEAIKTAVKCTSNQKKA